MLSIFLLAGSAFALNLADYPAPQQIPAENPQWTSIIEGRMGTGAPVIDKCNGQNQWAFTFDDGPTASTAIVLEALAAKGQKATFFVIGTQVLYNEQMLKRIVRDGHQIAIHTWSHPSLPPLTVGQIVSELVWTAKIIKDVTGFTPTVMRPPLGEEDDKVRRVATAMGLSVVKWNRDSNDWRFSTWTQRDTVGGPFQPNDTPDAISRKFTTWVSQQKEGAISLQHDVYDIPSRQAAPAIDIVINADYQLTSLADCIDKPAYSDNLWTILNVPVADNPINVPRLNNSGRAASLAPATNGNKTRRAKKSGADSRRLSGALAFGVIIVAFLGLPFQ